MWYLYIQKLEEYVYYKHPPHTWKDQAIDLLDFTDSSKENSKIFTYLGKFRDSNKRSLPFVYSIGFFKQNITRLEGELNVIYKSN